MTVLHQWMILHIPLWHLGLGQHPTLFSTLFFLYPNGSMVVHMLVSTVGCHSFSKKVLGMNLSPVTLGPSCHFEGEDDCSNTKIHR